MRAEMLSHFTSELIRRKWDITVITDNRQDYFDYLIEDDVKRYSMDTSFHPKAQRQQVLQAFVEEHPEIDQYLFCGTPERSTKATNHFGDAKFGPDIEKTRLMAGPAMKELLFEIGGFDRLNGADRPQSRRHQTPDFGALLDRTR